VVFTVEQDTAREHAVTIGASDGEYIQLLSGLDTGARVVTVGQQTLADGDKVNVVNGNGNGK
jgi:hypothetical protein